jgi:hypothetical protein
MQLPADLREGWWHIRWVDDDLNPDTVYLEPTHDGDYLLARVGSDTGSRLSRNLPSISAMERVAPPSWEKPDA